MQIPGSKLGELLKQRKRSSLYDSLSPDQGLGAGLALAPSTTPNPDIYSDETIHKDRSTSLNLDTERPTETGLDDIHRLTLASPITVYEDNLPLEPPKHAVTYDELRKQNREEYLKKSQNPYNRQLPADASAIIRTEKEKAPPRGVQGSKLVEDLTLLLSKKEDREAIPSWVHKLSSPGYNVVQLRDIRNRYMLMLCLSLITDSIEGPFIISPPTGVLTDLLKISAPDFTQYEWELDKTWEEEVSNFREVKEDIDGKIRQRCPFHRKVCPKDSVLDRHIGQTLDKQFRFLLFIARPYVALLFRSSDKLRAAKWIQTLCLIDRDTCAIAKGVRNDYMMILVGYLSNQSMIRPFQEFPLEKLLPLPDIAKMYAVDQPITDPTHPRTAEFFRDLPTPEEGAFALITCTGNLYEPKYQ